MGIERYSYKVRVRVGFKVRGYSNAGATSILSPGEYVAHWLSINRAGSTELEAALRFLGAHENMEGDDIHVFRSDWPALKDWPDLPADGPFELLM